MVGLRIALLYDGNETILNSSLSLYTVIETESGFEINVSLVSKRETLTKYK
jgi:hypothetical protein